MPARLASTSSRTSNGDSLSWLEALTNAQLHRLAVLIGAGCSGTKKARVTNIRNALTRQPSVPQFHRHNKIRRPRDLSLISIDLGIRNLAYANFVAAVTVSRADGGEAILSLARPRLQAWRRLNVSCLSGSNPATIRPSSSVSVEAGDVQGLTSSAEGRVESDFTEVEDSSESFDVRLYASHAYEFVKTIVATHHPTHIVVERQRFRSGGGAAVQEWTIRVGMFEAMLHAVLETLARESSLEVSIAQVLPARVNRYWMEQGLGGSITASPGPNKLTGKEMKNAKVNLVGQMLQNTYQPAQFEITEAVRSVVEEFLRPRDKKKTPARGTPNKPPMKLDDLADCALQGLAWMDWQANTKKVLALGREAFDLET